MTTRSLFALLLAACGGTPTAAPVAVDPAAPVEREAPPAAAGGGKLALAGTITFAGATTAQAVFVSVKDPTHPGPPLAAKKLPPGPFPLTFTLTDADLMQMGPPREIPATVALTVSLDSDGNAMTKEPGDPRATLETPSSAGDLAVALVVAP